MSYVVNMTREEKNQVRETARALGVSPSALYREIGSAPAEPAKRVTIAEELEWERVTERRATARAVSMAVTAACKAEVIAARGTKEHALARLILSALSGRGVVLTSYAGNRVASGVQVHAVTDRRGTLELHGTVTVIRNRRAMYKWEAVGAQAQRMSEAELLDMLGSTLPARLNTVPARFRDSMRPKRLRQVSDRTGEAATPGVADGAEATPVARPARRGTRGLTAAHKREINRQRNIRYRARLRELRATDGRTHALRPAEPKKPGTGAVLAPKPVLATDTAPVYRAPAPDKGKTFAERQREADKVREAREAAKREAVTVTAPEPEAVPVAVPAEPAADTAADTARIEKARARKAKREAREAAEEKQAAEDAKWIADMHAKHPELFGEDTEPGTLF